MYFPHTGPHDQSTSSHLFSLAFQCRRHERCMVGRLRQAWLQTHRSRQSKHSARIHTGARGCVVSLGVSLHSFVSSNHSTNSVHHEFLMAEADPVDLSNADLKVWIRASFNSSFFAICIHSLRQFPPCFGLIGRIRNTHCAACSP